MKKLAVIIGLIFVLAGIFIFVSIHFKNNEICKSKYKILKIGETELNVEIANTNTLREKGLSDHKNLNNNEGMLFIFDNELIPGFWMKDMLFPINIIWIDKNYNIIGVENNISPSSYPKIFSPKEKVKYVLEVGIDSDTIKEELIGRKVVFECNK